MVWNFTGLHSGPSLPLANYQPLLMAACGQTLCCNFSHGEFKKKNINDLIRFLNTKHLLDR